MMRFKEVIETAAFRIHVKEPEKPYENGLTKIRKIILLVFRVGFLLV